jgi:hypothetical protein
MGRLACFTEDSSPTSSSLFISRPTTKKKTAMRPSFIQWCMSFIRTDPPRVTPKVVFQKLR